MRKLSLNGIWTAEYPNGDVRNTAVPGCFDRDYPAWDVDAPVVLHRKFQFRKEKNGIFRLRFSAVSYASEVSLNGVRLGSHEGMWDAFELDAAPGIKDGENEIEVTAVKPGYRKDSRYPVRSVLSGFIPDVLCSFGGIWDDAALVSADEFTVSGLCCEADASGTVRITAAVHSRAAGELLAAMETNGMRAEKRSLVREGENSIELSGQAESFVCWSPAHPKMYECAVSLAMKGQSERIDCAVGFRSVSYEGTRLQLNGEPFYLRGVLHWGYYDEAIIPNPSRDEILDEIKKIRAYGFNAVKHCLYVPREEYFKQADEQGMLLWIELPVWLPEKSDRLNERIRREFTAIVRQLRGHPSVCIITLGCEMNSVVGADILEEMYRMVKANLHVPVRDNSGSGECYGGLQAAFGDFFDYHFYAELHHLENLMEMFTPAWRNRRPWFFGEYCDSDTLRSLRRVCADRRVSSLRWASTDPKVNPINLLKDDFYLGRHDENMRRSGIEADFDILSPLSVDHSLLHRKITVEQTRAFPEIGGYNITALRDVPIATSGLMDDCMRPKFDAARFRAFNGDVVLVPAWNLSRAWIQGDRVRPRERYNFFGGSEYSLRILVSNYGPEALINPVLDWTLTRGGKAVAGGEEHMRGEAARGEVCLLADIAFALPDTDKPDTLILRARIRNLPETQNEWPVFLYPRPNGRMKVRLCDPMNLFSSLGEGFEVTDTAGVLLTSALNGEVEDFVQSGGKALYMCRGQGSLPARPAPFWRESMVRAIDHPLMNQLKRESWMDDLRYFGCAAESAFETDRFENAFSVRPLMRRYDCRQWEAADYLVECRAGSGILFATTLRLDGGAGKQPLGIQNNPLSVWMIQSLLSV